MLFMYCVCHAFVSVHCCLVVTCWERADLLALVCDVYCDFVTFPFGILGLVWFLNVLIPDPCHLFFTFKNSQKTAQINIRLFPKNKSYQSPPILTELFQHNLINVSYLTACYLYQVMMTLHFLNDVANDIESTQKPKITS